MLPEAANLSFAKNMELTIGGAINKETGSNSTD